MIGGERIRSRAHFTNDAKQATRQHARMGMSQVDMALWDLAGKLLDQPIYRLLGEQRKSFPAYASTYIGDDYPGGLKQPRSVTRTSPRNATRWVTKPSKSTHGRRLRSKST